MAVLLLIENSREMASCWSELRAHYLPTLLGTMRVANPVVPIQVLLLPTSPASTSVDKSKTGQMEYNEQLEIGFNLDPQNRIMPSVVQRAVHSLATTFEGIPSTRHLIVIAASDAAVGTDIGLVSTVHTGAEWQMLSQLLVHHNIQLHMILRANQKMDILTDFFYRTLRAQGKAEGTPWFQTDEQKYRLLLSTERKYPLSVADMMSMRASMNTEPTSYALSTVTPSSPLSDPEIVYPTQPVRQALPRSQTFPPPAAQLPEIPAAVPCGGGKPEVEDDNPKPSLVTRLKKIHGMTKKRTYGANASTRPPLTRSDLSAGAPTGAPTGGNISPGSARAPLPYHRSAAARAQHFSPVEGPAPLGPRRRSKAQAQLDTKFGKAPSFPDDGSSVPLTSPMSDSTPSSPTSSSTVDSASFSALTSGVVTPSSGGSMTYSHQQDYYASNDSSLVNTALPRYAAWTDDRSYLYPPSGFVDTTSHVDSSGTIIEYPWAVEESWQGGLASQEMQETSKTASVPAASNAQAPLPISGMPVATTTVAAITTDRAPVGSGYYVNSEPTSPAIMDGDQPFIFNPEYEARVAARYEETMRAAGMSAPSLPLQHPTQTGPPPLTAPRPSLYVSTHSSSMHSAPPSLQASPIVTHETYRNRSPPLQAGIAFPRTTDESGYNVPPPVRPYGAFV